MLVSYRAVFFPPGKVSPTAVECCISGEKHSPKCFSEVSVTFLTPTALVLIQAFGSVFGLFLHSVVTLTDILRVSLVDFSTSINKNVHNKERSSSEFYIIF